MQGVKPLFLIIKMKQIKLKRIYKIKKEKQILKDKKLLGFVDYYHKIIYLKKGKSEEKTLYHEIAHTLIYEMSAGSKIYKTLCFLEKLGNDENFIDFFAGLLKTSFKIKYHRR